MNAGLYKKEKCCYNKPVWGMASYLEKGHTLYDAEAPGDRGGDKTCSQKDSATIWRMPWKKNRVAWRSVAAVRRLCSCGLFPHPCPLSQEEHSECIMQCNHKVSIWFQHFSLKNVPFSAQISQLSMYSHPLFLRTTLPPPEDNSYLPQLKTQTETFSTHFHTFLFNSISVLSFSQLEKITGETFNKLLYEILLYRTKSLPYSTKCHSHCQAESVVLPACLKWSCDSLCPSWLSRFKWEITS